MRLYIGMVFYIYIDPDPQKYFDLENRNNFPMLDFYFTLGNTSQPIEFNGVGFSLKLGVLSTIMNGASTALGHVESGRMTVTSIKPAKRLRGR